MIKYYYDRDFTASSAREASVEQFKKDYPDKKVEDYVFNLSVIGNPPDKYIMEVREKYYG